MRASASVRTHRDHDFRKERKLHFSLMKGFNITRAFSDLGNDTYFASTGEEEVLDGIVQCGYKLFNSGVDDYNKKDLKGEIRKYKKNMKLATFVYLSRCPLKA